jgi:antitoxin HicB
MATAVRRALDDYLALPYRISLSREHGEGEQAGWLAQVEELPGCAARGDSPERAARAIRTAMRDWMEEALSEGKPIPEPRAAAHSGRLLLRMPQTLHAELARRADQEGVSLNQLIVGTLAAAMGWRQNGGRAPEAPELNRELLPPSLEPRRTPLSTAALVLNMVVVAIAGGVAIALLIAAWGRW